LIEVQLDPQFCRLFVLILAPFDLGDFFGEIFHLDFILVFPHAALQFDTGVGKFLIDAILQLNSPLIHSRNRGVNNWLQRVLVQLHSTIFLITGIPRILVFVPRFLLELIPQDADKRIFPPFFIVLIIFLFSFGF